MKHCTIEHLTFTR